MDPSSLLMLALMLGVLYLLVIMPQQRRVKAHQKLVASIETGDEVITIGGLHGKVQSVADDELGVELAPGVVVRLSRHAVARKLGEPGEPAGAEQQAEQAGGGGAE